MPKQRHGYHRFCPKSRHRATTPYSDDLYDHDIRTAADDILLRCRQQRIPFIGYRHNRRHVGRHNRSATIRTVSFRRIPVFAGIYKKQSASVIFTILRPRNSPKAHTRKIKTIPIVQDITHYKRDLVNVYVSSAIPQINQTRIYLSL